MPTTTPQYGASTAMDTNGMAQRRTRLRQMAASCRMVNKHSKEDVVELRGVLDLIAAEKVRFFNLARCACGPTLLVPVCSTIHQARVL